MVVVGAGECGVRSALALRENRYDGRITVLGAEDVHTYERPPLSKAVLLSDGAGLVHPFGTQQLADAEIDAHQGSRVSSVDREGHRVVLASGEAVAYDRLLLAVGAEARRLPDGAAGGGDGGGGARVLYLRTHADALAIRPLLTPGRHIGILGAGFIGLEIAASARLRGCDVTVFEFADRALARAVPAEVAAEVTAEHESRGVRFVWGEGASQVWAQEGRTMVRTTSGAVHDLDALVVGIGAVPTVDLAEAAGLQTENGIRVDDRLRTSDPDIFAAGDCASSPHPLFGHTRIRLESWRSAHDQAVTVAQNLLGGDVAHTSVPWFWSDQYDASLQVTGLPQLSRRSVVRHRPDGVALHFGLDERDRLVSASAFGPGNSVAKDIRLVEMLLQRQVSPGAAALADPGTSLKSLLSTGQSVA